VYFVYHQRKTLPRFCQIIVHQSLEAPQSNHNGDACSITDRSKSEFWRGYWPSYLREIRFLLSKQA